MTTKVVKFNIGGQRYEVSRSLLQMHPNSMLAKSASDQWQEDPEAEIFIEGDSGLFRYVLRYLRHGFVTLPITESKEALTKELDYYGIDVSENDIDDSAMHKAKCFDSFRAIMQELEKSAAILKTESDRTEIDYRCAQLAVDCAKLYLKDGIPLRKGSKIEVFNYLNKDENARKNMEELRSLVNRDDDKARKGANVHLNAVGLNLSVYKTVDEYYYDNGFGFYLNKPHITRRKIRRTATLEEIDVVQTEEAKD